MEVGHVSSAESVLLLKYDPSPLPPRPPPVKNARVTASLSRSKEEGTNPPESILANREKASRLRGDEPGGWERRGGRRARDPGWRGTSTEPRGGFKRGRSLVAPPPPERNRTTMTRVRIPTPRQPGGTRRNVTGTSRRLSMTSPLISRLALARLVARLTPVSAPLPVTALGDKRAAPPVMTRNVTPRRFSGSGRDRNPASNLFPGARR